MKRYGLSVAFIILIIISIGSFYIQAGASRYPNFELATQYGDEAEIDGVSLSGSLVNHPHYRINPALSISALGSQYMNRSPLFNNPYYWTSPELQQLVDEHRSFMRGKYNVNSLFEDDDLLVYVETKSDDPPSVRIKKYYFEVSVLDKKQNKSWSYEASVPSEGSFSYISVYDVQVFEDEIVVVTANHLDTVGSEYHRYNLGLNKFGLNSGPIIEDQVFKLPRTERVGIKSSEPAVNFNVRTVYQTDLTQPSKYSVFYGLETQYVAQDNLAAAASVSIVDAIQQAKKLGNHADAGVQVVLGAQIVIYDLQTGLEVVVDNELFVDFMTNELVTFINLVMAEDILYLTKQSEQGVMVMEYNIADAEAALHDIQLDNPTYKWAAQVVKQQRLYVLAQDNSNYSSLVIVDLNSDEVIYRGTVELNENERYKTYEGNELRLQQIVVN